MSFKRLCLVHLLRKTLSPLLAKRVFIPEKLVVRPSKVNVSLAAIAKPSGSCTALLKELQDCFRSVSLTTKLASRSQHYHVQSRLLRHMSPAQAQGLDHIAPL
jgi:hypothetical protein